MIEDLDLHLFDMLQPARRYPPSQALIQIRDLRPDVKAAKMAASKLGYGEARGR